MVLIEAMAMERRRLHQLRWCSGHCGRRRNRIFVNPGNDAELADAIEKLYNNSDLRQRMGKAGRRRVEELFDQRHQITRLEGIYRELISGKC